MRVTLVGSGRYARDIVARNYRAIDPSLLSAVITPRDTAEALATTPLTGLPLLRSAREWREHFGCPGDDDIFDLCIHPSSLLEVLQNLVEQGASRFVLPKPVATTRTALDHVTAIVNDSHAVAAVASQWHYSLVTEMFAATVAPVEQDTLVSVNFSQAFTRQQLEHYTPATALLPHMLQILFAAGLWGDDPRPMVRQSAKGRTRWELTLRTSAGCQIELVTDLDSPKVIREVRVERKSGERLVTADFLARFERGSLIAAPSVTVAGVRHEIRENNIREMLTRTVAGLRGAGEFLTLDCYRPQADALLALCEA